jgi:hypothetical protein
LDQVYLIQEFMQVEVEVVVVVDKLQDLGGTGGGGAGGWTRSQELQEQLIQAVAVEEEMDFQLLDSGGTWRFRYRYRKRIKQG